MRKPLYFVAIAAALAAGPALAQTTGTDSDRTGASETMQDTGQDRMGTQDGDRSGTSDTMQQTGQDRMGTQDRTGATGSRTDPTGARSDPAAVEPAAGQDMQDQQRTNKDKDKKQRMGPVTTSDFITKAAMSGRFEVESSELVAEQTENAEVSAFARQMINDHTKANERLKELAQSANQGQGADAELDDKHQEKMNKLREASGADLDRQYIEQQVKAHEKAVELFRNYAQSGDDVGLRGFAKETLPTLERHLDHAQRLQKAIR